MQRTLGIVATLALVAALSGCSEDGEAEPAEPSSSASEGSSQPSGQLTESTEPTSPASPTTDPATGALMELEHSSVRVPELYDVLPYDDRFLRLAGDRRSAATIALEDVPIINPDLSLDEIARINIKGPYDRPPQLLEPVTIAGLRMYHAAGPVDEFDHVEQFGGMADDYEVSITFTVPLEMPAAKRQRMIESVLATLELS